MSATRNCGACSDLQENSADFVVNGVTEAVCNSLQNDTGFSTDSDNDDCTDLNNANDCLIGNMEDEVASYQACDWKDFMPTFIHNLWTVIKSMICAICGLWKHVKQDECAIDVLLNGIKFTVGEESEDGSYVAAGKGVSFLGTGTEEGKAQITLRYISGGLVQVFGTLICYKNAFYEENGHTCVNFDNGSVERTSNSRKGNSELNNTYGTTDSGVTYRQTRLMTRGGELLYEIRILKSQYPMIKRLFAGFGFSTGGGEYHVNFIAFDEGSYAYGQHGSCKSNGSPEHSGDDSGHLVPEGYYYVQCRMISITYLIGSTYSSNPNDSDIHRYTPRGFMGIRINQDGIECDVEPTPDPPDPTPTEEVTVTAVASPSAGGTVSGGGTFTPGETCTLTATSASGYSFTAWGIDGSIVSFNNPYSFTVSEDVTVTAGFLATLSHVDTFNQRVDPGDTETITLTATPTNGATIIMTVRQGGTTATTTHTFTGGTSSTAYDGDFVIEYNGSTGFTIDGTGMDEDLPYITITTVEYN